MSVTCEPSLVLQSFEPQTLTPNTPPLLLLLLLLLDDVELPLLLELLLEVPQLVGVVEAPHVVPVHAHHWALLFS